MSDFIYSTKTIKKEYMKKALHSIYKEEFPQISYFHGPWGCLGITHNIYNGFEPYETEKHIVIVIGGPLLTFAANDFLTSNNNNDGTKLIYERWLDDAIIWDEDLNGPYSVVIVNKKTYEKLVVTDIMSYIPIYDYKGVEGYTISSHVDILSNITNKTKDFDEVSLVDFILHGAVTYPYTTYKDIYQIQPASEHLYSKNNVAVKSYWEPHETNEHKDISETAELIREKLVNYINMVLSQTTNIAQFISGGEDSRTLSGILQKFDRDAYIYLDGMNREGKLAKKIAEKYNASFNLSTRDKFHYLHVLEECTNLIGSGAEYHHAHTYGFHKSLKQYDAVFGGLFSDALLKGARIKKNKMSQKFIFIPDTINPRNLINENLASNELPEKLLNILRDRRLNHFNFIKQYRNESAEEWFELWPSSMNRNIANIYANRRLFKSYEPFLSNDIVKISASCPQSWKLNRKLFNLVAKPLLKETKWVMHGDGWLPYYSYKLNSIISFFTWSYRQLAKRIGIMKGNQGPWASWKSIINSKKWEEQLVHYRIDDLLISSELKRELSKFIKDKKYSVLQYIAFTQVAYQLQMRYKDEKEN